MMSEHFSDKSKRITNLIYIYIFTFVLIYGIKLQVFF